MEILTSHDWTKFRNMETLPQKAGVSRDKLGMLVAKELADNALDHCGHCEIGLLEPNGYYVKDNGNGIDPFLLPDLFSINRPFMSSKIVRMPTRGALGNGLRVVSGAVIASGGTLQVSTQGKSYDILFQADGTSIIKEIGDYDKNGTKIEIQFGVAINVDLTWAESAIRYNRGEPYKGKTSGYWYTSEAFYELCQGFTGSVRDIISEFDGCTGTKAGKLAAPYKNRLANTLVFDEVEHLLGNIQDSSKQVNPDRFGGMGEMADYGYYKTNGKFFIKSGKGRYDGEIPFAVEAWVNYEKPHGIDFLINKSPITGQMNLYRGKHDLTISGCGLFEDIKMKQAHVIVNVITPYMPIVSDGKEPDLKPMENEIVETIKKVSNRAKKFVTLKTKAKSQKDIILENLHTAIEKASGGRKYRFSLRQLFYAIRPYAIEEVGKEPEYNYFCTVITNYEAEYGDIELMYRDNRGTLYHPHLKQDISVGTIAVENYTRPNWTFNKVLYIEKEGFFNILKDNQIPEKYDMALLTSKGYASRAVKDLLDTMGGDSEEEITFFCIHDADAAGTKIYDTLQNETKARPGRKVKIINLGLDPKEAIEMGLEVEKVESSNRDKAVADYLEPEWKKWLQTKRVELNAMTTPQFLDWLERKLSQYDNGKVLPPEKVIEGNLDSRIDAIVRQEIQNRILLENHFEEKVMEAKGSIKQQCEWDMTEIRDQVNNSLEQKNTELWSSIVGEIAQSIVHDSSF